MRFPTPYTVNREWSRKFATENTEESLTQQSDAAECDINVIMKRYQTTGQIPGVIAEGLSGDFSEVNDFRSAVDKINAANEAFAQIRPEVRARFGHDPGKFIEFINDEKNLEEARRLGIALPAKIPDTTTTPPSA